MSANSRQVAGKHYEGLTQHWDFVVANNLDYFQAQITRYITRCKKKNGKEDLEKAIQYTIMEIKDREYKKYRPVIDIDSAHYFGMIDAIGEYEPKKYKLEIYKYLIIYLFCLKKDCIENLFKILEILKERIEEEYPE